MRYLLAVTLIALGTLASSSARADNFVEVAAGFYQPIEDNDYENAVDTGLKLGVRAGSTNNGIGFEVAGDWSPMDTAFGDALSGPDFSCDARRLRLLAGVRGASQSGRTTIFYKLLAGVDHVNVSCTGTLPLLGEVNESDGDLGFALEPAAGVLFNVGQVKLGPQIGLPISYHDRDSDEPTYSADYTSVDLELLFVAQFQL